MSTTARQYQLDGVEAIHRFGGRALLADEMGLGKSYQALLYFKKYCKGSMLIVCPAAVKYNWQDEALKHFGMRSEVLEGQRPPRRPSLQTEKVVIINYDILKFWWKHLIRMRPELLVLDEIQYIKTPDTKRSLAVNVIAQDAKIPKVIGLSGTPMENRPFELWHPLHVIRPKMFKSQAAFGHKYCDPQRMRWGWEFKGATNKKRLHRKLSQRVMIRRLKSDVLDELPEKTRVVVPLDLPKQKLREYKKAETDFLTWVRETHGNKKAKKAAKAEMLVQLGYLYRLAGELKADLSVAWIQEFLETSDNKLISFGTHHNVLDKIKAAVKHPAVITGNTTSKKRQLTVKSFQSDPRVRLFVGQIGAAGVGITLTAASHVVFTELSWVPAAHTQAEARPHRIGQDNAVTCYYLIARDTIEERLCKILQYKMQNVNDVLDGGDNEDKLDVFKELRKSYINGKWTN